MRFDSIIILIVLTGAVIGLVNNTGLFGEGYMQPIEASYELSGFEDMGTTNVWDQFYVYVVFAQIAWEVVTSALHMLIFAYPMLIEIGTPPDLALVLQGGIWIVTGLWIIDVIKGIR